jgi:hypothetical protein
LALEPKGLSKFETMIHGSQSRWSKSSASTDGRKLGNR